MKTLRPRDASIDQLVESFKEASFGLADEVDHPKQYRKFYDHLRGISAELRRRGPDARRGSGDILSNVDKYTSHRKPTQSDGVEYLSTG
jgi:hypothetical protein